MNDTVELKSVQDSRSKWIGVYVGVLAALLAMCGVGGGNATKDATRANIEVANMWACFQSKNVQVHFDTGNIMQYQFPEHWIPILGRRIKNIHFKEWDKRCGH